MTIFRKTLKQAFTVNNGKVLIISQERNNSVKAIDLKTSKETQLIEGGDDEVRVLKLSSTKICLSCGSKLKIVTFD